MRAKVVAALHHRDDSLRIHAARRARAGAVRLDHAAAVNPRECLRHLAAVGVFNADEHDALGHAVRIAARAGLCGGPQRNKCAAYFRTARDAASVPLLDAGRGRVLVLKATAWIFSLSPFSATVVSPVVTSQMRTVPSQLLLARYRPSPESDRQRTDSR